MLSGRGKQHYSNMLVGRFIGRLNTSSNPPPQSSPYNIFMYFEEWSYGDKAYDMSDFPASQVTHMLYAFAYIQPSETDFDAVYPSTLPYLPNPYDDQIPEGTFMKYEPAVYDANMTKLATLKASNPNLKTLISIGGWSLSWNFHPITASSTFRDTFAVSVVDECIANDWDGVDIDWEYPSTDPGKSHNIDNTDTGGVQPANLQLFLARIRLEMDNRKPSLLLTAVSGSGVATLSAYNNCNQYLDFLGIMTYDFVSIWDGAGVVGHQSTIYENTDYTQSANYCVNQVLINVLANTDIPLSKIHIGLPTYARGWRVDSIDTANVELSVQSASQPDLSLGTDYPDESGIASYRDLKSALDSQTLALFHDNTGKCNFAYDTVDPTIWTFTHPEDFAVFYSASGCGGIICWASTDDALGSDSLVARFKSYVANPYTIIYPSIPNQDISLTPLWENTWDTGSYRIYDTANPGPLFPLEAPFFDDEDPTTSINSGGFMEFNGDGIMIMGGGSPRWYHTTNSLNTEAYCEYKRIGTNGDPAQGFIIGLRAYDRGHSAEETLTDNKMAHTFYFKYTHAGNLQIDTEPVHNSDPDHFSPDYWETYPAQTYPVGILVQKSMPALVPDAWISMKAQCYNDNGTTVLKLYINDVLELSTTYYHPLMYDNLGGSHTMMMRNGKHYTDPWEEVFEAHYRNFTLQTITVN